MGYYIRALTWKKKSPRWKVQFISYKKEDAQDLKAKKPQKTWDVFKERWRVLGFLAPMTLEEAKARAKQLNSMAFIKKQEESLRRFQLEENQNHLQHKAFLPEEFVDEFEKRFLRVRDSETIKGLRKFSRAHIIWRAAQHLIISVKLDPSEWVDNYCPVPAI
jgi:hypothetical protein